MPGSDPAQRQVTPDPPALDNVKADRGGCRPLRKVDAGQRRSCPTANRNLRPPFTTLNLW